MSSQVTEPRKRRPRAAVRIALLNGFRLSAGEHLVAVPGGTERLLAFFALHRGAVPRQLAAGTLWPEVSEHRAYSNLRSALSRLRGVSRQALDIGPTEVGLADAVTVDLHRARSLADRIVHPDAARAHPLHLDPADVDSTVVTEFSAPLLPGWYEDWTMQHAAEWQLLRLHALEALTAHFILIDRPADAIIAADAAVHAEPLRESARAALIQAHLAVGNEADALRTFQEYERLLQAELGLHPTPRLCSLITSLHTVTRP